MRRTLLAVLVLLLLAGPAAAYTIFLKDGSRLQAREKYKVQGANAHIILPNGNQTVLPLAQIDVPRTERGNASDYGDAMIVDAPTAAPQGSAPQEKPRLSDVAAGRRLAPPPPRPTAAPVAAAPAAVDPAARAGGSNRTESGAFDFLRAQRTPLSRMDLGNQLGTLLRAKGVESPGLYEGTEPGRVLVEVVANSEGAVFQTLAATSLALLELDSQRPGAIPELELFMATDRRQRAGQFLLTPDRARELTTKRLDVSSFFLKYVEF
jgi:hypothetical protein